MGQDDSVEPDVRLIERWLPISAIGVESTIIVRPHRRHDRC